MNTSTKQHVVIDTDTASDDAVAILMALAHPDLEVDALTIVSGNVSLKQASINARYTLELADANIPVYEGCAHPLLRTTEHAEWFHGPDGMGDMNYPPPIASAQTEHATDELIKRFSNARGELSLITLGPLTNIASALMREPALAGWIKHCYVMGGAACTVGNVTPAAEYNIWCDPEAAHKVFHSGVPITMIGWELSRHPATLDDDELATLKCSGSKLAAFAVDCNAHALRAVREIQGETGLALADPVAMAIALDASICTKSSDHYVDVSCDEAVTRGMTVVDQLNVTSKPANVKVCWELDALKWKSLLWHSLGVEQTD